MLTRRFRFTKLIGSIFTRGPFETFIFISLFLANYAMALDQCRTLPPQSPEGTKCITAGGFEFERVKNGWKDLSKYGKAWFDQQKAEVNLSNAKDCGK